jgi:hypothetical protein
VPGEVIEYETQIAAMHESGFGPDLGSSYAEPSATPICNCGESYAFTGGQLWLF